MAHVFIIPPLITDDMTEAEVDKAWDDYFHRMRKQIAFNLCMIAALVVFALAAATFFAIAIQ